MKTSAKVIPNWNQLTLFVGETHAPSTPEPGVTEKAKAPISPDTSLPWLEDYDLGGWSAKMFLHQLLITSMQPWHTSDTEQLLSEWTPLRLRANLGSEISLSDVIKKPGKALEASFRTSKMVQGLIRRSLARGRSLRLLLRTEQDTIPVIVTFTNSEDYESWTVTSGKDLLDSQKNSLLDFLRQHAPASVAMP